MALNNVVKKHQGCMEGIMQGSKEDSKVARKQ
jgi:hypothetical protein